MRTILLLDVDGVVSPLPLRGNDNDLDHMLTYVSGGSRQVSSRWAPFAGPEWLCTYAMGPMPFRPALVTRLNTLIESGVVEPRWLTSWDESANTLTDLGLAGLPWPVEKRGAGRIGGKIDAVIGVLRNEPDAKVVWCDDDIDPRITEIKALRTSHADRLLTIRPKRTYGLTDDDVNRIAAFAAA